MAETGSVDNTLNFATSTYGVTFNLQEADGTSTSTMSQNVDAARPVGRPHRPRTNDMGSADAFTTLVCSNMGDDITASTGSTIVGGRPEWTRSTSTRSATSPSTPAPGQPDPRQTAPGLGNINYDGDANASAEGAVSFMNLGSVSGNVNFYGDQGSTTFTNGPGAGTTGNDRLHRRPGLDHLL